MSLKEIARRLFAKSVHRCAPPPRKFSSNRARLAVTALEDRVNLSNLNLSASIMPSTIPFVSSALLTGSVSSTSPMTSLSLSYTWGDGSGSSDSQTFSPSSTILGNLNAR